MAEAGRCGGTQSSLVIAYADVDGVCGTWEEGV